MPAYADAKFTVAVACRMLARNGCEGGVGGQVSARLPGADTFVSSALEHFALARPDAVRECSIVAAEPTASADVSPAVDFHAVIYAERPEIGALVHVHSHSVSVLCTLGHVVGQYNVAASLFFEDQALYEDDGTLASVDGKRMLAALDGRHVLWMKNHGAVILADTVENATIKTLTLELVAGYHLAALRYGGTETSTAEVRRVKAAYERSYLPAMWSSNVRLLLESDPDLFTAR